MQSCSLLLATACLTQQRFGNNALGPIVDPQAFKHVEFALDSVLCYSSKLVSIKHIGLPSLLMFATDTVARILVLARFGFYKLCSICTPLMQLVSSLRPCLLRRFECPLSVCVCNSIAL